MTTQITWINTAGYYDADTEPLTPITTIVMVDTEGRPVAVVLPGSKGHMALLASGYVEAVQS